MSGAPKAWVESSCTLVVVGSLAVLELKAFELSFTWKDCSCSCSLYQRH
jgi:hypothetical protein